MRWKRTRWHWLLFGPGVGFLVMMATSVMAVDLPDRVLAFRTAGLSEVSRQMIPSEMRTAAAGRTGSSLWLVQDGDTWRAFDGETYPYRCALEWAPEQDRLYDACHLAYWDRSGLLVAGPPRQMAEYPVALTDKGLLLVDLNRPRRTEIPYGSAGPFHR